MTLAFIAFHMRDYQRDTQHLPLEGHGAYFLLLQHCWTHGRIPLDDAARAAICKVSVQRWRKGLAPLVAGYFDEKGENRRATVEIAKAEKIRLRQAMAGHKGGSQKALNNPSHGLAAASNNPSHGLAAASNNPSHGLAAAKPRSSRGLAIKNRNITSTFAGAAREAQPVDNSASEAAEPAAGFAKQARDAVQNSGASASSYLVEALNKRGRNAR